VIRGKKCFVDFSQRKCSILWRNALIFPQVLAKLDQGRYGAHPHQALDGDGHLRRLILVIFCAALQFIDQIEDILLGDIIVDRFVCAFFIERNSMKIPIIEKSFKVSNLFRKSAANGMIDTT
jgi:hypothetical protein